MSENKNPVIGLLGGGQLGRMLCEAANPLGIDIAILDEESAPAKQAHNTNLHVTGSFKDPSRIRELAAKSDFLSVEIEHVETEVLEDIEKNGVKVENADGSTTLHRPPVHPSWRTIRLIQDKYLQKEHFRTSDKKIPIADQVAIESGPAALNSLKNAAAEFGFPFMVKARKGSYDGRGNFKVDSEDDFEPAVKALGGLSLYAEKWAPFVKELAVMVIRTEDNKGNLRECVAYPAVETIHEDSVCTKVFMPPRDVSETVCEAARKLATEVISTLWGRGVFAVEMFVLEDGKNIEFIPAVLFPVNLHHRLSHGQRGGPSSSQLGPLHHRGSAAHVTVQGANTRRTRSSRP
jgi:phosphoribosylaminoimidazole carboxylase